MNGDEAGERVTLPERCWFVARDAAEETEQFKASVHTALIPSSAKV